MRIYEYFFVYLLLVISACTSCRSTKTISDFREKSQVNIRSADSLNIESDLNIEEYNKMDMLLAEGWEIDYTIYLPPDSTGIQAIRSQAKIKRQRDIVSHHQRLHNKDETTQAKQVKHKDESAFRETKEKAENFKFLNIIKYIAYILFALIAFTLIYKFRKWLR